MESGVLMRVSELGIPRSSKLAWYMAAMEAAAVCERVADHGAVKIGRQWTDWLLLSVRSGLLQVHVNSAS